MSAMCSGDKVAGMLAEPVLGKRERVRTDELAGRKAVPGGGLFDEFPLGIGEADRARTAHGALIFVRLLARSVIFSIGRGAGRGFGMTAAGR